MIVRHEGDDRTAGQLRGEALALKRRLVGNEHSEVALGLSNVAVMRADVARTMATLAGPPGRHARFR